MTIFFRRKYNSRKTFYVIGNLLAPGRYSYYNFDLKKWLEPNQVAVGCWHNSLPQILNRPEFRKEQEFTFRNCNALDA